MRRWPPRPTKSCSLSDSVFSVASTSIQYWPNSATYLSSALVTIKMTSGCGSNATLINTLHRTGSTRSCTRGRNISLFMSGSDSSQKTVRKSVTWAKYIRIVRAMWDNRQKQLWTRRSSVPLAGHRKMSFWSQLELESTDGAGWLTSSLYTTRDREDYVENEGSKVKINIFKII